MDQRNVQRIFGAQGIVKKVVMNALYQCCVLCSVVWRVCECCATERMLFVVHCLWFVV